MYASKSLDGTIGKLMTTAAGIEGRDGSPVARQLPPQYGRSFAGTASIYCIILKKDGDVEKPTSSNDQHWPSVGVLHRRTSQC